MTRPAYPPPTATRAEVDAWCVARGVHVAPDSSPACGMCGPVASDWVCVWCAAALEGDGEK